MIYEINVKLIRQSYRYCHYLAGLPGRVIFSWNWKFGEGGRYRQMFGGGENIQIYIKKSFKTEIITPCWGDVVSQLGEYLPPLGGCRNITAATAYNTVRP